MSSCYGYHLSLRVDKVERHQELKDETHVSAFLGHLVEVLGFRTIAGPLSASVLDPPEHAGISSVVILYESHAAIHTYASIRSAFVDVFACRQFEEQKVPSIISKFFGRHTIIEKTFVPRGSDWTKNAREELKRWHAAR